MSQTSLITGAPQPFFSNIATDGIGNAIGCQLVFLPLGLLLAAVLVELTARVRKSEESHHAVIPLLAATVVSALIAVLIAGVFPKNVSALTTSPFSSLPIGSAIAVLALVALALKKLSLRPAATSAASKKPAKRGRRRGRRHASRGSGSLSLQQLAAAGYPLILLATIGLIVAAPMLHQQDPPQSIVATEPQPEPEPIESTEPTPEPAPPRPVAVKPPAPEPAPIPEKPGVAMVEEQPEVEEPTSVVVETKPMPPVAEAATKTPITPPVVERKSRPVRTQRGGLAGAETYKQLIQPIFRSRCYSCHGDEKQKGDLRLDTPEWIRKGGKSGPILIAGDPDRSYLQELISLEPSDDDIMPPKGKPLSAAQISWIAGWIREGAALGDDVAWPQPESAAGSGIGSIASGVAPPDPAVVQALLDSGVSVRQLSGDGGFLEIDYSHAGRAAGDLRLDELIPIAINIQSLDLKRTKVTDADLAPLAQMGNLQTLQLQRTKIGDASLQYLTGLRKLESLNFYNTQVSDDAIPDLKQLTSLKKVFLWSSKVTPDGARDLASVLGSKVVNMGE